MHPAAKIGHVHLTVSSLERSLEFYRDILGFEVTASYGSSVVFLSAGGYHHHIALNTWEGEGVLPQPRGYAGLYHFAILLPSRKELALAVKRLQEANYPIVGASDHGVSEAIYLLDPDDIGIELYADRPKESWTKNYDETIAMITEPLDMASLMSELQ